MANRFDAQRERRRALRQAGNEQAGRTVVAPPREPPRKSEPAPDPGPPVGAEAAAVEEIRIEIVATEEAPPATAPPDPEPVATAPPMSEPPPAAEPGDPALTSAAIIDFANGLRSAVGRGVDFPSAIERATTVLPGSLRGSGERIAARLSGDYAQDEWGYDEELVELVYPFFKFMYEVWWRVTATGVENMPSEGSAMIVANHAGVLPWDATMMRVALYENHQHPRPPRFMVLDWAFRLPWVSAFMRRVGGVVASPYNAMRLLDEGHLVMVFPEGTKGAGKPFSERYRLQRFGRGGFVEMALRTGAPIVPVAIVGSEEIYPKIGESRFLARLIGAPYFPITPTFPALGLFGAVPLPSRWRIEFCPPVDLSEYGPEAAEDRALVFEISEQIRETIQEKLFENLVQRGSAFL
jgi:1-acyl-sn-glycerol-3-phosphate acyltransferase